MTLELNRLATVQVVPPTPFTADGRHIRPDVLGELVAALATAGVKVFVPAAGTGEFHSLAADEIVACVGAARRAAGPEGVVLAPVGLSLGYARAVGHESAAVGADALLVMPPVHPYLSDAGLRDYYTTLARNVPLPLLVYKKGPLPSHRLLLELAAEGHIAGVKYADADLDAFTRFADACRNRLRLYCGIAERFAPFFALAGAEGYTSGAACLCPRLSLALHRCLAAGDFSRAMAYLRRLRPIEDFRDRDGHSFSVSFLKFALKLNGRDFGPPRPPQRVLTATEEAEAATILKPVLVAESDHQP